MGRHGKANPTQAVYRKLLDAMSRPGKAFALDCSAWSSPLLAVCDTLLDHEVSYRAPEPWDEELFALTKARRAELEDADFVFFAGSSSGGLAAKAKTGELAFPDRSATLVYVADAPLADAGPLLSGPGIEGERRPEINLLDKEEWRLLKELNAEFPLGVDVVALCGSSVLCVPRSTRTRI